MRFAASGASSSGDRRGEIQRVSGGETSGKLVIEAKSVSKSLGGRDAGARALAPHRARRPARHRRAERRRQDDAGQHADRRNAAGCAEGSGSAPISKSPRSTSAAPALDPATTLKEALTRTGGDNVMVGGEPRHVDQLHEGFPVRTRAGGAAGRARCRAASAAG